MRICRSCLPVLAGWVLVASGWSQVPQVRFASSPQGFELASHGRAAAVVVEASSPETVRTAATAFCGDVESVTGQRPVMVASLKDVKADEVVIVGVVGQSGVVDRLLREAGQTGVVAGKWESAVMLVVEHPVPGVKRALVIAGSDRRGAAYALFGLSRAMGVSPWTWWADVPVVHHAEVYVDAKVVVQAEPSVRYRGIFLNDEDWGLRPWAAATMDKKLGNIGPRTYERIFELLLRLRANSLWPAMHPGTAAFNTVEENARLADKWGIVMGSSHSEALLRSNVGEWDEKRDGPWNYQVNRKAIDAYWDKRLAANGGYENFYTVGMRGVHDGALEATGSREQKAKLVEEIIASQEQLLAAHKLEKTPRVIWLYKESLDLYRVGMKVPDDVTLGFTDDNYGYIRELPTVEEQRRAGGAGVYYHVSYWGAPHDYLWLCSTPVALMREELTKAFDHGARRYWVLNVGDLKPAEADLDYFMQLAWDEPTMAAVDQHAFLKRWYGEQFGAENGEAMAAVMDRYSALNFVRKPEFMGFNGYNDGVQRTQFNPLAWGDQSAERLAAWRALAGEERKIGGRQAANLVPAYFELVGYPVEAAAAQNEKFLLADRTFLDTAEGKDVAAAAAGSKQAYERVQTLTAQYNGLLNGKWSGMMSANPRERQVFRMPELAVAKDAGSALPKSWGKGDAGAVASVNAAHFVRSSDGTVAKWMVMPELGISGGSVVYGRPGVLANAAAGGAGESDAWLEYEMTTAASGEAMLEVDVLPTFPVDSAHGLRFGVTVDGRDAGLFEPVNAAGGRRNAASTWEQGALENFAVVRVICGELAAGKHVVRLRYVDPGVVFEHVVLRLAGAAPGYPVPPETAR